MKSFFYMTGTMYTSKTTTKKKMTLQKVAVQRPQIT